MNKETIEKIYQNIDIVEENKTRLKKKRNYSLVIISLITLAIVLSLFYLFYREYKYRSYINEGIYYLNLGELTEARNLFIDANKIYKNRTDGYTYLYEIYDQEDDTQNLNLIRDKLIELTGEAPSTRSEKGSNTLEANILNGGYIAYGNGKLYVADNQQDNLTLYEIDGDTKRVLISESPYYPGYKIKNLIFYNNRLYYLSNAEIRYYDFDNNEQVNLNIPVACREFEIYNDTVYFAIEGGGPAENENLYSCSLEGNNLESVFSQSAKTVTSNLYNIITDWHVLINKFVIYNDVLYASCANYSGTANYLLRSSLQQEDGSASTIAELDGNLIYSMAVMNNNIYIFTKFSDFETWPYSECKISVIDLNTGEIKDLVNSIEIGSFNIYNNNILYIDGGTLYQMDLNGNDRKALLDTDLEVISKIGGLNEFAIQIVDDDIYIVYTTQGEKTINKSTTVYYESYVYKVENNKLVPILEPGN